MLKLEVLISTLGTDGIGRVAAMRLPQLPGVTYLVSWQRSDGAEVPDGLAARTDVTVVRNPGIGLSQNRNYALDRASGDVLLTADDDLAYDAEGLESVRAAFEGDPGLDIGLFRYRNEEGAYEKTYPQDIVEMGKKIPKNYYCSSVEIAIRRSGPSGLLRFNEEFGLGAPVLHCGEEEVFLLEARRAGDCVKFFPIDICVHRGSTTGLRRVTDKGVYRGMGAVTSMLYPFSCLPRFVLMAWRGSRRGTMSFFPALLNFAYGAAYALLKIKVNGGHG